jgi:hypothetical protein
VAHRGLRVHQVHQDHRVAKEAPDRLALQDHKEAKETPDRLALQDHKVVKEAPDRRAPQDLLVPAVNTAKPTVGHSSQVMVPFTERVIVPRFLRRGWGYTLITSLST